jgi:hypothetical protein
MRVTRRTALRAAGDYERAIRYFADWNGFLAAHSDWLTRIDDVSDFARANAAGKTGVMLTFQDSRHFCTPDDVRTPLQGRSCQDTCAARRTKRFRRWRRQAV